MVEAVGDGAVAECVDEAVGFVVSVAVRTGADELGAAEVTTGVGSAEVVEGRRVGVLGAFAVVDPVGDDAELSDAVGDGVDVGVLVDVSAGTDVEGEGLVPDVGGAVVEFAADNVGTVNPSKTGPLAPHRNFTA